MSEAPLAIGIDFGTSKSLLAGYHSGTPYVPGDPYTLGTGKPKWTPSVVNEWRDDDGGAPRLLVGWEAYELGDSPAVVRHVKRSLGDPGKRFTLCGQTYSPVEVAAVLLLHIRCNAEMLLPRRVRDVVLSIPANFGGVERAALLAAARFAGLNPVRLVNEPTAAALVYTHDHPATNETLLIFDFGAGTLDITVLRKDGRAVRVRSTHGDPALGGSDFDLALRELLRRRISAAHGEFEEKPDLDFLLLKEAEGAKMRLSTASSVNVALTYIGQKNGRGVSLNLTLTRDDFLEASRPLLERARRCLHDAMRESGLAPPEIDRVLLVGGTVMIPAVERMVREVYGDRCVKYDPRSSEAEGPVTSVAEGAAILAAHSLGQLGPGKALDLKDVTSHGLGIKCRRRNDPVQKDWYGPLIAPNQEIPYSVTRADFSLSGPANSSVTISLYEGFAADDCPLDASFKLIQERRIEQIPPSENGDPRRVQIEFSYDENAIARLKATVIGTGRELPIVHDPRVTRQDVTQSGERVRELWQLASRPEAKADAPVIEDFGNGHHAPALLAPLAKAPGGADAPDDDTGGPDDADDALPDASSDARLDALIARGVWLKESGQLLKMPAALRGKIKAALDEAVLSRQRGSREEKQSAAETLGRSLGDAAAPGGAV